MWDFFWKPSELAELFENVHLGRLFLIAEIFAEFGEIKESGREFFFNFSPKSPIIYYLLENPKILRPPQKKVTWLIQKQSLCTYQ